MPSKRTLEPVYQATSKVRRSCRLAGGQNEVTVKKEVDMIVKPKQEVKINEVKIKHEITQITVKQEPPEEPRVKVEIENDLLFPYDTEDAPKPNVFPPVLPEDVSDSQPKNWSTIYNEIVKMRALITTPVDTMGCERMPDSLAPNMSRRDPKLYRFQLLIALMLSSQTKDETNFAAMQTLKAHFVAKGFPDLTLEAVLAATEAEIDLCICKVGFHRRKAVYIKKACELLRDEFDSDIPKTIEGIVSLPGVGPKMGHLLLQNGWKINMGIGVDVHIHRLAQMWNWVPKSDKPEVTRLALQDWLPKKYWADINPLLVGFGQTVCVPKYGNCDVCFLAKGLCKGVNRKLANSEFTEARLAKLAKQRGDLSGLVALKLQNT